jgi:deazaflavin-dependent oxidoreductase (nitroreductase family)
MTTLEKTNRKERKDWLRRFNRKVTNPIMMTFAGRRLYSVVEHVGRRSKKVYHTPVLGQPAADGFIIPLPYGADTDWCLNVQVAGGCTIRWNRQTFQLVSPHIVDQAVGEAVFPPVSRFLLRISKVQQYLKANCCSNRSV